MSQRPPQDYGHEVRLAPSRGARLGLLALGHLCVALGVIGLFLPVMPTTVFFLGAAACYARASAALYNRLLNNRVFGPVIADWRHHRAIPRRARRLAIGFVWVGIGASAAFGVERLWLRLLLLGIGAAVTAFLLSLRGRD